MDADSAPPPQARFHLKIARLSIATLVLHDADVHAVLQELGQHLGRTPDFFDADPVLIDLTPLQDSAQVPDFPALKQVLRSHNAVPVAVHGGNAQQQLAARQAGLALADFDGTPKPLEREVPVEVEVLRQVPHPPLVIDQPLRSGQSVHAPGDLVLLAPLNPDAEATADGSIHVYAPLRGRVHAGIAGEKTARIFSTCMQAQMLSIAGVHYSDELPETVHGHPGMAWLENGRVILGALEIRHLP